MATTVSRAATVTEQPYPPDTRMNWTFTVPIAYDLSTVTAIFEIRRATEVIFRYSSADADTNLTISGQTVLLTMAPEAESEDDLGHTFATAMALAEGSEVPYNLDLSQTGLDVVDYRFQGVLKILPEHGEF